jgi:hypothetical protein
LDGTPLKAGASLNTAYAAPIAVAAMLEMDQPDWLDALYDSIRVEHQDYFEDSINLLCQLVLSHNFWDPTLLVAPNITAQPTRETVLAGRSAAFTVKVSGSGFLTFQWYFNGVKIMGATRASYAISRTAAVNAGNYSVVVNGAAGSATSQIAVLMVLPSATRVKITGQPAGAAVAANGTATFIVTASGTTPLGYRWQKNFTNLANGSRISGTTTASLKITSVGRTDAGYYRVLITNPAGPAMSAWAKLTVN